MLKDAIPLSELHGIIPHDFPYSYTSTSQDFCNIRFNTIGSICSNKRKHFEMGKSICHSERFLYLPGHSDYLFVIWKDNSYFLSMTRDDDSYNDCLLYNIRRTIDNLKAKGKLANKSCAEIYDIASAGFMPIPSLKSFDEGAMLAPDGTLLLTSPDNDSYAIKFHYSDGITARLRKWHEAAMAKRQSQSVEKEKPNQNCPLVESTPKQSEQPSISKVEKGITMSENRTVQTPFGFDLSFTQADPNLVMGTMIGIAIRSAADAPWRIYDRDKHEIVDLGNLQMGNLPVWEGPAIKIKDGDIIKHDATYYYCESRKGQHLTAIDIATGKKQEIIMPKNILGMNIYRKLFSFVNLLGDSAELSDNKLLMMMAMQNGEGMQNNLMPLMLLKDGDFDENKLFMVMAMSSMGGGQDTNNNLIQLLLMKELLHTSNTPNINDIVASTAIIDAE